ncbi:MAG: SIMPL domain-containing protein [Christensenellales bacterium]
MEKTKLTILVSVIITLIAAVLVFNIIIMTNGFNAPAASIIGSVDVKADTVEVYGQGRISAAPDVAYLTLGVENLSIDPKKAQEDNSAKMENLINALKNAGIDNADIQTSSYEVYPRNRYSELEGFTVTNLVTVTLKDVGKASEIIKTAYDAGANYFRNISFDILDRKQLYMQALDMANGRALEKAEKLAANMDRRLAGVVSLSEGNSGGNTPYYIQFSNYDYAAAAPALSDGGIISSGELEITAIVYIVYRLN